MKINSLILTIGLSLFALSGLLAQDKYEYATVRVKGLKIGVATSANPTYQLFDIGKDDFDVALIKKVEEMSQQGWEIYNTTSVGASENIYFLRKKKNP
ncbi:MAG TPA: hypothetical protein VK174_18285 [Chitinophagales bacterium]|nr:hypothetical protein [Chitinophagales bacterium]